MLPVKDQQTALEEFRSLPPIAPRELVGLWKEHGIPTGHPFDGVLENLSWFGKRFTPDMRVDACCFDRGTEGWLPLIRSGSRFGWRCVFLKLAGCASRETCFPICSAGCGRRVRSLPRRQWCLARRERGHGL